MDGENVFFLTVRCTGGASSGGEMIILSNSYHGDNIRVCMGIFTITLTK